MARRYTKAAITKFLEKVERTPECWWWLATPSQSYGHVTIDSKALLAHRVSYEMFKGPIPTGLYVLHECDHPRCVNPKHLFLGTHKDNMADRAAKGRGRGEGNARSKLTNAAVRLIRKSHLSQKQLAAKFSVSAVSISYVLNRRTWQHI